MYRGFFYSVYVLLLEIVIENISLNGYAEFSWKININTGKIKWKCVRGEIVRL